MCLLTLTSTNNGRHEVRLLQGGIGKVHGGLSERDDLFLAVFGKTSLEKYFHEFECIFVTD